MTEDYFLPLILLRYWLFNNRSELLQGGYESTKLTSFHSLLGHPFLLC